MNEIVSYHNLVYDRVSGELIAINNEHHEMHAGKHFFNSNTIDIDGTGTVIWFMFITPDTTTRIHAKALFDAEAEFKIEIKEGGTVSDNGSSVITFNNDRDSDNEPELKAYSSATVTGSGTTIWTKTVGSGKDSTGVCPGLSYEIIAKRNTIYLFKITKAATSSHYINYDFFWYEHVPKEDP